MDLLELIKPSKTEQKVAYKSYAALAAAIGKLDENEEEVEIEIEESKARIKIPLSALKFLSIIVKAMSQGKPISLVPIATEVTTQKAAEVIGCSRPHLIKLLEKGDIAYTMVGRHRRIMYEDVMSYRAKMKAEQKQHIIDMMKGDEESGLYDI